MSKIPLSNFLEQEVLTSKLGTYKTAMRSFLADVPDELTPTYDWYIRKLYEPNKLTAISLLANVIEYSRDILRPRLPKINGDRTDWVLDKISSSFKISYLQMFVDELKNEYQFSQSELEKLDVYQFLLKLDPKLREKSARVHRLRYLMIEAMYDSCPEEKFKEFPGLGNVTGTWLLDGASGMLYSLSQNGALVFPEFEDLFKEALLLKTKEERVRQFFKRLENDELELRRTKTFREWLITLHQSIDIFAHEIAKSDDLFDRKYRRPFVRANTAWSRFETTSTLVANVDFRSRPPRINLRGPKSNQNRAKY